MRFATSKKNRERSRDEQNSQATDDAGRQAFGKRRDKPDVAPDVTQPLSVGVNSYRVPRSVSPPIVEEPEPPLKALRLLAGPSGRKL